MRPFQAAGLPLRLPECRKPRRCNPREIEMDGNSQTLQLAHRRADDLASTWDGNFRVPPSQRVVLVHCSASSSRQWRALVEQLVGFNPVPIDLWGHGNQSSWHGSGPFSLSAEADAIRE